MQDAQMQAGSVVQQRHVRTRRAFPGTALQT